MYFVTRLKVLLCIIWQKITVETGFTLAIASSIIVGKERLSLSLSHNTSNAFSLISPGITILLTPGYVTSGGGVGAFSVPSFADLSSVVTKHVLTLMSSSIFSDRSKLLAVSRKYFPKFLQIMRRITYHILRCRANLDAKKERRDSLVYNLSA